MCRGEGHIVIFSQSATGYTGQKKKKTVTKRPSVPFQGVEKGTRSHDQALASY